MLWDCFESNPKPLAQGGSMVQSEVRSKDKERKNGE